MISGFVVPLCKHKKKKNQNSLRNHTLNTQNDKVETDKMHLFEKQKTDEGIHQNACSQKLYISVFLHRRHDDGTLVFPVSFPRGASSVNPVSL